MIPSSKGENGLSLGIGYPIVLHGSAQLFYSLDNNFGFGIGTSGYWMFLSDVATNYYYQFRFLKNEFISASVFYEKVNWKKSSGGGGSLSVFDGGYTDKNTNSSGAGVSVKTPIGLLNTNISIPSDSDFHYGLISGMEITQENGVFYGVSFFEQMFYIGLQGLQ